MTQVDRRGTIKIKRKEKAESDRMNSLFLVKQSCIDREEDVLSLDSKKSNCTQTFGFQSQLHEGWVSGWTLLTDLRGICDAIMHVGSDM